MSTTPLVVLGVVVAVLVLFVVGGTLREEIRDRRARDAHRARAREEVIDELGMRLADEAERIAREGIDR